MAVDKIKPLGLEEAGSGTDMYPTPTELNPNEDYVSAKGVSFENSDNFLAEKIGGVLKYTVPDSSYKPAFLGNGEIDSVEIYEGATQTTEFRRVKITMAYDGSLNPVTETWDFYDPNDGTTILRTITVTHTWSGVDLTKSTEVTA